MRLTSKWVTRAFLNCWVWFLSLRRDLHKLLISNEFRWIKSQFTGATFMFQELEDGLILRAGTESDINAIKKHVLAVHGKGGLPMVDRLFRLHPDFSPPDNFLIEDTKTGKVVAYYCLKLNTGVLGGQKIPVGQMEIVGTLEGYRNRGLIRKINEAFEQRVEEYKLPLVIIAGIPFFYRKLGYEYAIRMGGSLTFSLELIPPLKKSEKEPILIEEVTTNTFVKYLKTREKFTSYLDLYRDLTTDEYLYLSTGKLGDEALYKFNLVRQNQKVVGIFTLNIGWGALEVTELWVENLKYLIPLLRFWKALAKRKSLPLRIYFPSGPGIAQALESISRSKFERPYAWYVKIPSIKRFVETIKPVIEQRVANSDFKGLTDSVRISWYHEGIELVFKDGILHATNPIPRSKVKDMDVAVPFPVIYQLLLGYRTIDELYEIFPDAGGNATKTPIIRQIFPKLSAIWSPEF
ncbi:GNAT family N-acetyltransferase [Candidatus Bathyarchaeota archaeon]|nr:GNAT family N-acetyltransferase [Candidatus Bathyarchaeota archaeon]